MRKLSYIGATVACAIMLGAPPASAHNAGCVETGNGGVVTVGSGKSAPFVSENNPHYHVGFDTGPESNHGRLDLVDADNPNATGDQYGARFAADQGSEKHLLEDRGQSAVQRPGRCVPQ